MLNVIQKLVSSDGYYLMWWHRKQTNICSKKQHMKMQTMLLVAWGILLTAAFPLHSYISHEEAFLKSSQISPTSVITHFPQGTWRWQIRGSLLNRWRTICQHKPFVPQTSHAKVLCIDKDVCLSGNYFSTHNCMNNQVYTQSWVT